MNIGKQRLTMNGIMMSYGDVLASDVMVEHDITNNTVHYSYKDECGYRYATLGMQPYSTFLFDANEQINGIITNKSNPEEDWFLFWDNN